METTYEFDKNIDLNLRLVLQNVVLCSIYQAGDIISATENLRLSCKIPKDIENALQGMIAVAK